MLCLRARLPRQSADNLRRTRIQGFAHKLPCRRQKKTRFTRPSALCRFEGRLRKSFSLHYAERAGRICRGVPKVSGSKAYDATPLPLRFAPQKRTLRLYNSIVACLPRVALRHERPSDSVGTKTTRGKEKGRTRRPPPFGLPVGTRTRNNAVGGHRFIQLDYG